MKYSPPNSQQEFELMEQDFRRRTATRQLSNGMLRIEYKCWERDLGPRIELAVSTPWGHWGSFHFSVAMLEELHDMLGRFLEIGPPPVNVRVELVAPAAPPARPRRKRSSDYAVGSAERLQEEEKESIKRRMLDGK